MHSSLFNKLAHYISAFILGKSCISPNILIGTYNVYDIDRLWQSLASLFTPTLCRRLSHICVSHVAVILQVWLCVWVVFVCNDFG